MPSQNNRSTSPEHQSYRPDDEYTTSRLAFCEPVNVTVKAQDVLPLLADAALANRAWLEDFSDDVIQIPQDLYEVLIAYKRFRTAA